MVKNPPAMQEIWVRSLQKGNSNPLQCSCLENSMNRGVRLVTDHIVAVLDTTEQLTHIHSFASD